MGLVQRVVKSVFGTPSAQSAGGLLARIAPSGQAPKRGTREIFMAYARLPWLYAGTSRIAVDVAGVATMPMRPAAKANAKAVQRALRQARALGGARHRVLRALAQAGELEPVEAHPLLDLMAKPCPAISRSSFVTVTTLWILLRGEAFWVMERGAGGQCVELWPVPPHWVQETPTAARPTYRFSFGGWQREVPEGDVVWLKRPDPVNPFGRGTGWGAAISDELDVDEYAAEHLRSWFFNRAMPDLFISGEGIETTKQAQEYEAFLKEKHQGRGRGYQVHVTTGKLDVQEVGQTFRDMQLAELRKQQRDTTLQTLGIPPEVMGIVENSNRATIDGSDYVYAKRTLVPHVELLVDGWQVVADTYGDAPVVGYESPVPEDRAEQLRAFQAAPTTVKVDEWRKLQGLPPLGGAAGEELYKPFAPPQLALPPGDDARPALPPGDEEDAEVEEDEDSAKGAQRRRSVPPRPAAVGPGVLSKGFSWDAVRTLLAPERLTKHWRPVQEREVVAWGQGVLEELGAQEASFDLRNPLVADVIEQSATTKIKGLVNETTRQALRDTLDAGVYAGEGIRELKQRVADTFAQAKGPRAEMIARTEVVGSSNAANLLAYELSGLVEQKEWLAVQDGASGERHHEQMDGQVRGITEAFEAPSGARAQAPGSFGEAGEDINCRCTLLPKVGDPTKGMDSVQRGAAWKAYDAKLAPWERALQGALQAGFSEQEDAVLSYLDALA